MAWTLTIDDIDDLARGAAILGAGGGGDPYIGALLAKAALREHGPLEVVTVGEVPADAQVVAVGLMGAPTVMVEKLPGMDELVNAVRAVDTMLETPVTHIVCLEAGGINSTIPIAAAAALGLPLIDCDGMGRAFPELQMVLPTLKGVSASPMAFGDDKGNRGALNTVDNSWTERIARVACVEMGCSLAMCLYPQRGAQLADTMVLDSLGLCVRVGRAIAAARGAKQDPVAAAAHVLGGREMFAGKVVDVERATTAGFARGKATIVEDDSTLVISFQNEHLVAEIDGEVTVTTPDLIVVVERDTGEPITTEGMRYGQRVRVIAAPSDERWHSPEGLALVGPSYFGYDIPSRRFDGTADPA